MIVVKIIITDDQKFLMDNDECYRDAVLLSVQMSKDFYPDNEEFYPLESTRGVISQIDNMVTGLKKA